MRNCNSERKLVRKVKAKVVVVLQTELSAEVESYSPLRRANGLNDFGMP